MQGMNVLLAEDNDIEGNIIADMLKARGAAVSRVKNGREAVEIIKSNPPQKFQVFITDIQMPETDGLTASAMIRAANQNCSDNIIIIAMTSEPLACYTNRAKAAGINVLLQKPIDIDNTCRIIKSAVKRRT